MHSKRIFLRFILLIIIAISIIYFFKLNSLTFITENINPNQVPYISTYYIDPIVSPNEDVIIDFYVTDFEQKEYINEDYSEKFTIIVNINGRDPIIKKNVNPGDNSINIGKFSTIGEQKFSIIAIDKFGRSSHELFNFFLVQEDNIINEYVMTDLDLIKYNIKNNDTYESKFIATLDLECPTPENIKENLEMLSKDILVNPNGYTCIIADSNGDGKADNWWSSNIVKYGENYDKNRVLQKSINTRVGIQKLINDKKSEGFNKVKLLPGIYRIDHTGTLFIPSEFTLDMNGATFKLNQFTGSKALMVELNNTIDSHLINGTIEGDYYSHDYTNSENSSEGIIGISIGGESKYSSYENIIVKDITGYGAGNSIAKSPDNTLDYTYFHPTPIENTFKLGDIDRSTGYDIDSSNRTTSDFIDIDNYSQIGYLSISRYLGYQGNPCDTWNLICHFYDSNKNYIKSIDSYQYRRIETPENSSFIRITILSESYPSDLSIQYFRVPTHCSFKNIKFENCRAVGLAQSAMKDMLVENCQFENCGQTLAKCAYDAEDGWDMMQDVTFRNLNFYNNYNNDFVAVAGHNFVIESIINGKVHLGNRNNSYSIKNCKGLSGVFLDNTNTSTNGYKRFSNNTILGNISINSSTENSMLVKDCRILNRADGNINDIYLRCTIGANNFPTSKLYEYGLGKSKYIECTIKNVYSLHNYMGNYYNCNISNIKGEFQKGANSTMFYNCKLYNIEANILQEDNFSLVFDSCTIIKSRFDKLQEGTEINISFNNNTIEIDDSLIKLRTCSLQKPIIFNNNIITGSSTNGLINFYQDYAPSWGIVDQSNLILQNNSFTLPNSLFVINGLNKDTINKINIISSKNSLSPNNLKLCNPDSIHSNNITLTEN